MITEYIRYNLPTGLNAQFETDYAKAIDYLQASVVCRGCDLTHCEEEPQRYILRILWTSTADHLQIFRGSEEFKGFFTLVQPYIPHIEEMQHYQFTPVQFSRAIWSSNLVRQLSRAIWSETLVKHCDESL